MLLPARVPPLRPGECFLTTREGFERRAETAPNARANISSHTHSNDKYYLRNITCIQTCQRAAYADGLFLFRAPASLDRRS